MKKRKLEWAMVILVVLAFVLSAIGAYMFGAWVDRSNTSEALPSAWMSTTTAAPTTTEALTTTTTVLVDLLAQPTSVRSVYVAQVAFNHCGEDLGEVGGPLNDCMGAYVRAFPTTQSAGFPDRIATFQDVLSAQVASENCGEGIGLRDAALLDCMFKYMTGQPTPPTTVSKGP